MGTYRTRLGALIATALVLSGSTASQALATGQDEERLDCYQKVLVNNSGAFLLYLTGRIEMPGGGVVSTDTSDVFATPNSRTIDFAKYSTPNGARIWPRVQAVAGEKKAGQAVRFCANNEVAVYKVTGTTYNVTVTKQN